MQRLADRGGRQDADLHRHARDRLGGVVGEARVVRDDLARGRLSKERDERGGVDLGARLRVLLGEAVRAHPRVEPGGDADRGGELHERHVRRIARATDRVGDGRESLVIHGVRRGGRVARCDVDADGVDAVRTVVRERFRQGDHVGRKRALEDGFRVRLQRRQEAGERERTLLGNAPREAERPGDAQGGQ